MLNPALLTVEQKTDIMEKFSVLEERGIVDINQDLNDATRQEFDRTVLKAFGIEKHLDNITNSLKAIRCIRKAVKQHAAELGPLRGSMSHKPQIEIAYERAAEGEMPIDKSLGYKNMEGLMPYKNYLPENHRDDLSYKTQYSDA